MATIPKHRLDRLGAAGESDLRLLMYIDSYHDFKGLRGKIGQESCVPFIDSYMIENGIVKSVAGKSQRDAVLGFFAGKGIQYSKIEQSSRMYYEKTYNKTLYGTQEYGTTQTVVTYSDITKIANMKADAIRLELDSAFQTSINTGKEIASKYKAVGNKFLDWMFPDTSVAAHTEVGISIDAKAALIDDLLLPLNDKRGKFFATQVVTPQNILDSARTSFNVLPGIFNDATSRVVYTHDLSEEYANVLTSSIGHFRIVNENYDDEHRYGFKWQFVTNASPTKPINIPVSQFKNSGPSVNFLANMAIGCNGLDEGNKRAVCLTKIANIAKNATMVDPTPVLQTLSRNDFKKLCIDIKRLGDHEQANAVYMRNKDENCIFVTGDTLSGLYSRILGNPTIYVSTPAGVSDEDEEDSSCSSALLSYRGLPKVVSKEQLAKRRLEYSLDSLNYVLTIYSQIAALADGNALNDLKTNIETYVDRYQYIDSELSPDIATLYNLLIRWRVYDILAHIHDIQGLFATSQKTIVSKLKEFETTLVGLKKEHRIDSGLNIVLKAGDIAKINAAADAIETTLAAIREKTDEANNYIKYFNNAKAFDKDGNTIFTFKYELYFSNVKIAPSLAFLNFFMSDIDWIAGQFARLKRGKILRSSTDEQIRAGLSSAFFSFVSKFYKSKDIDGNLDILLPIYAILNKTNGFTAKPIIDQLIQSLSAYVNKSVNVLKPAVPKVLEKPAVPKAVVPKVVGKAVEKPVSTVAIETSRRASSRLAALKPTKGGNPYSTNKTRKYVIGRLNSTRKHTHGQMGGMLPDFSAIFSAVIDISTQLCTNYPDMFDIVSGDKAIYTQYSVDEVANVNPVYALNSEETEQYYDYYSTMDDYEYTPKMLLVGGKERREQSGKERREQSGKERREQSGGELVKVSAGLYASDYGFHHQFYKVVKTLIEMKEICEEYRALGEKEDVDAAHHMLDNATEVDDTLTPYTDIIAKDEHNRRLFDTIGQQWLTLDSLFDIKGPPDFSIESKYPKNIYNDVRLYSEYQTIIQLFGNEYNSNTFGQLCMNMTKLMLFHESDTKQTIDTFINTLPTILRNVITNITITSNDEVEAAKRDILLAKLAKIDYYLYEVHETFTEYNNATQGMKDNANQRHQIAYSIRQIEELVVDAKVLDDTNAYVNYVALWCKPKGSSSVSSTIDRNDNAIRKNGIYYAWLQAAPYEKFSGVYNAAVSNLMTEKATADVKAAKVAAATGHSDKMIHDVLVMAIRDAEITANDAQKFAAEDKNAVLAAAADAVVKAEEAVEKAKQTMTHTIPIILMAAELAKVAIGALSYIDATHIQKDDVVVLQAAESVAAYTTNLVHNAGAAVMLAEATAKEWLQWTNVVDSSEKDDTYALMVWGAQAYVDGLVSAVSAIQYVANNIDREDVAFIKEAWMKEAIDTLKANADDALRRQVDIVAQTVKREL